MSDNKKIEQLAKPAIEKKNTQQKTNEKYGFYFSSALKIFDPATGKVLVQMRCD